MVEHGHKIEEKVKAMQSEIKKNIQGTNSEGEETRTPINNLEQKEEINIQPINILQNRMKKQEFKKMRRGLGTSWTSLNVPISESGAPEGEEKEQEIENFFEKIMKENFPNLAKEIDVKVQEAQRVPKKLDPRRHTPRHIIITSPKIKNKERILKAAKERKAHTYKGVPIKLSKE